MVWYRDAVGEPIGEDMHIKASHAVAMNKKQALSMDFHQLLVIDDDLVYPFLMREPDPTWPAIPESWRRRNGLDMRYQWISLAFVATT